LTGSGSSRRSEERIEAEEHSVGAGFALSQKFKNYFHFFAITIKRINFLSNLAYFCKFCNQRIDFNFYFIGVFSEKKRKFEYLFAE
jgi:hypothetical protein